MCIFCEIVNGNIPSNKVYEDDQVIAILDISQVTKGHSLVLPKKHYETLTDCPDELTNKMLSVAKVIAKSQMKNLNAKGYNLLNNGYTIAGQTVMHAHIHVIPRYNDNDGIKIEFKDNLNKPNLDDVKNLLKKLD